MSEQIQNTDSYKIVQDDELSFIDLGIMLGKEKKLIFGLPLIVGIVALVYTLITPPIFTAKTTLVSPQGGGGGGSAAMLALAQLGGLGDLAGAVGGGGTSANTYLNMLKSRSAKDMLIEQFNLQERYKGKFKSDVYKDMDDLARITSDKKSGLITIEVDDKDPVFAANLANAYYAALKTLLTRVAVTEAQQRRVFFEQQFEKTKNDLSNAEVKMKEVQEQTGLIELQGQAVASITEVSKLRGEIALREVKLAALRTFATPSNPEYQLLAAEVNGLRAELRKLEKNVDNSATGQISAGTLPERGLEYVRALREVKYQEAIFGIMAKQFEMAKVDESKEGGNIQQLDVAVAPERKSKPHRALIVLGAVLIAGFVASILALIRQTLAKNETIPLNAQRLQALKKAWKIKR